MAEVKTTEILKIEVDYNTAITNIAKYNESLQELRAEEARLKQAMNEEGADREKLGKQIAANKIDQKQYTDAIRVLNKEIQNELRVQQENEGSLKGLRAELSNLTAEYDSLSRAEREGAKGKELQDHINEVTKEIKGAEYETQRFYRNVGNYPKEVIAMLVDTTAATGSLSKGFQAAGNSVVALGKQFGKLLLNPVVAFFAAIAGAVLAVVKVFNNSEERTNRLKVALAQLEPIINGVKNAFGLLADGITSVISVITSVIGKIAEITASFLNFIGIQNDYNEKVAESVQLEKDRQEAIRKTREFQAEEAEAELEVAKQREIVAQKDKYTREERMSALQKAIKIEQEIADKRMVIARQEYNNLVREAAMAENDAEMQNKLAEAKANLARAEKQYYDDTLRFQKQLASFNEEENKEEEAKKKAAQQAAQQRAAEAKRRADEAKREQDAQVKAIEDAEKKKQEALQKAEDALIALITDTYEQQYTQTKVQYEREIATIKESIDKERAYLQDANNKITEEERSALEERINLLSQTATSKSQLMVETLAKMESDHSDKMQKVAEQSIKNTEELEIKRLQLAISVALEYSEEKQSLEQQLLDRQKQQEIEALNDSTYNEQQKAEALLLIEEDYNQKSLELNKRYHEDREKQAKESAQKEKEIEQARYEFASTIFGGLSSILEQFGEDNKNAAKAAKILALGQIAVDTGKALAAGIKDAMAVPFPENLGAIATTTGAVLTGIASAISTVKSAKFAQGGKVEIGKYATGGSIIGSGTGTSDSITARVSNGESIQTALATSMFAPMLSAMNQMGGGVPIQSAEGSNQIAGEMMLARAVARGVAAMPRPVVSVAEITEAQNRVSAIEQLSTL